MTAVSVTQLVFDLIRSTECVERGECVPLRSSPPARLGAKLPAIDVNAALVTEIIDPPRGMTAFRRASQCA